MWNYQVAMVMECLILFRHSTPAIVLYVEFWLSRHVSGEMSITDILFIQGVTESRNAYLIILKYRFVFIYRHWMRLSHDFIHIHITTLPYRMFNLVNESGRIDRLSAVDIEFVCIYLYELRMNCTQWDRATNYFIILQGYHMLHPKIPNLIFN